MEIQYPDDKNIQNIQDQSAQILLLIRKFILPLSLVLVLLWLATGFYMVGPGEVGVIRRFGKEISKTNPGLRYHLPWPIDQANIVNLEIVRRTEIGFRSYQRSVGVTIQRKSEEALMLTGDENIVEVQLIIQYQIKDPSLYLFHVYGPDEVLHTTTEVALRSAVGDMTIDQLLTVGREKLQIDTQSFLQRLLDDYKTGVRIIEVRLQVVDPPDQVKDAFHEVVRAREDREKLINQAKGYQEDIIPKARGKAAQMIQASQAYQQERVLRAQGDAARFLSLLEEYSKAKYVTRTRLYLETTERILENVKKTIIDPQATTNVSGLLPLSRLRLENE